MAEIAGINPRKHDLAYEHVPEKRVRRKTTRFEFTENEEERMLQQAIRVSKLNTKREELVIPEAPVFYPTAEEFGDAIAYITKIRPLAEPYGICQIVPPEGWKMNNHVNMNSQLLFPTKLQLVNELNEGHGFDDGNDYNFNSYKMMAEEFSKDWHHKQHPELDVMTHEILSKDYWDMVETNNHKISVEYGNDLDTVKYGSGFPRKDVMKTYSKEACTDLSHPDYYAATSWNLNNIASSPGSLLKYIEMQINGVNVPWLYVGMQFASFCWHTEDNYLYSINYSHVGDVKQWYGVPAKYADLFEKVSKEFLHGLFRASPDILHHMTTQISPSLLMSNNVPVYKLQQQPGTFVVTFPQAYHGGFSYGFNVGEAVNFACYDWIRMGRAAEDRYRRFARESVFNFSRLLFTLWNNIDEVDGDRKPLYEEILRIIREERYARKIELKNGIVDITRFLKLPRNDFSTMDNTADTFDEMRICSVCRQNCILTAIGCQCDSARVSCLRHHTLMCRCTKDKKFLMIWESEEWLEEKEKELVGLLEKNTTSTTENMISLQ